MDIGKTKRIYFLGIGGIGMSALARYFKASGAEVSGYDRTETPLTRELITEGIPVHYDENISAIPCKLDLVVLTPAIPPDNGELKHIHSMSVPIKKRAEVLGNIASEFYTIAVAGTHGKTTISSIIAWILKSSGKNVTALIGGIAKNFGSNLLLGLNADIMVTEADEYDRSFLSLQPDIAVISSVDADHLDIYGSVAEMQQAFELFAGNIRQNGSLVCRHDLKIPVKAGVRKLTYGLERGECSADNIRIEDHQFVFDLLLPGSKAQTVSMQVPGRHNIENAVAASAVCHLMGLAPEEIGRALGTYTGVRRRFEIHLSLPEIVYIDDYAHHPAEILACTTTARELYPGKKITGIFQPHLFSRTRDLADDFANSFGALDHIILLPIYPAREQPIEGVTSSMLFEKIPGNNKSIITKNDLAETIRSSNFDVLITMGAGDIDQWTGPVTEWLISKTSRAER